MSRNLARRRKAGGPTEESAAKRIKPVDLDQHIDSEEDDDDDDNLQASSSEDEQEDLATKKVRLAKQFLERLEKQETESESEESGVDDDKDDDDDDDRIGRRLQRQRLKREGTFQRDVANKVEKRLQALEASTIIDSDTTNQDTAKAPSSQAWIDAGHVQLLRGHDLTPTSVALWQDGTRAISGAKDHSVLLWDVEHGKKLSVMCPHWRKETDGAHRRTEGQVLSVACSDDGRYAAVGSRDALVRIFDVRTEKMIQEFKGHKGPVTDLAFRTNSLQLFSASEDRCIRHYNLQEMMYMETLYGHQFAVTAIDCHHKERPISVGRDRTARAWKLAEDTHLIFRGGSRIQNAESISLIKDDWFLTGHEDGNLSLWYTEKKRAVAVHPAAHGTTPEGLGRGVVSVRSLYGSDICATGSCDGYLRLWKVQTGSNPSDRGLTPLSTKIPLDGYLNSIAMGPKARFAVVAKGQEHRLGRWNPIKGAKNRLAIVKLYPDQMANESDDDDDDENDDEEQPSKDAGGSNEESSSDEDSE